MGFSALDSVLSQADSKLANSEWMAAAKIYQQALEGRVNDREHLEKARLLELLAECTFRASFQAEDRLEFGKKMDSARMAWEQASQLFEKSGLVAPSKRALHRSIFATFWLRERPGEKREVVEKCIALADETLQRIEPGQTEELAAAYYDLFTYHREALNLAGEHGSLTSLFQKALDYYQKTHDAFEKTNNSLGILESFHDLVLLYLWADSVLEKTEYANLEKRLAGKKERVLETSKNIGAPYALCLGAEVEGWLTAELDGKMEEAVSIFEIAQARAENLADRFAIGRILTGAPGALRWLAINDQDVEKRRELLSKAIGQIEKAIEALRVSGHGAWLKVAYGRYAELLSYMAQIVETESERKKAQLHKVIQAAKDGISYESYGFVGGVGHELSKAIYFLATVEAEPEEKRRLLSEALKIREETVRTEILLAPQSWNLGVRLNYLALVKSELAKTEKDRGRKAELLEAAASDMQQCIDLCRVWVSQPTVPAGRIRVLAQYFEWQGDVILQLAKLTDLAGISERAIGAYLQAIDLLSRSENYVAIGYVRWKIANAQDNVGDYEKAHQTFATAVEDYRMAARKVPTLATILEDLVLYMDAWSRIEEARIDHHEEDYQQAAEKYTWVADVLDSARTWSYLSAHYSACSFIEQGEALARQEKHEEAVGDLQKAIDTLQTVHVVLKTRLEATSNTRERQELEEWNNVNSERLAYCLGRRELEEARALDRKGDERSSSRKYRSAAETFRHLLASVQDEQVSREIKTLVHFCEAWSNMKEAEVEASPDLYETASKSFMDASRVTPQRKFRFLALANSSVCLALREGTRFRVTQDSRLYSEIKKHLQTAAEYYQRGSFLNAVEWSRATQRLFDAIAYLAQAEVETDTKKKAELYHLAEKHLEFAANLYDKTGFGSKKEEALRIMNLARDEKQLLLTPSAALSDSPVLSGSSMTPVSLTSDQPTGVDRFEDARVEGKMEVSSREVAYGSELTFEVEVVNLGKTTATLVRLENVPDSFRLDRANFSYRVQDGSIDLKGKRIDYLKTHEMKLVLKAMRRGVQRFEPRLLFADERGNHQFCDLGTTLITVKELGIAGWIKGPGS